MQRHKNQPGFPAALPTPPWFAGVAIGLAILSMAGGAMVLGTSLALSQANCPTK